MAVKIKSIAGQVSALALALSALTLPANAQSQEGGREINDNVAARGVGEDSPRPNRRSAQAESGWARPSRAEAHGGAPAAARADDNQRGRDMEPRRWAGPDRVDVSQQAPGAAPPGVFQQGRAAEAPGWNRSAERRNGAGSNGESRGWENRGQGRWQGDAARQDSAPAPAPQAAPVIQGRSWNNADRTTDRRAPGQTNDGRQTDRSGTWWRQEGNRTYRDANRRGDDSQWRDRNREEYRRDQYRRDNDRRWDGHNDRNRYGYGQDQRRWDHRWRDNRRYDWYSYRRTYPSTFRIGSYYSPYRNYSYRRLSAGYLLDSLFFSSRYWINDPWQYRLPEVYGPYRWVRYYDDALLVDIYSGEVVDVIYSFFW